MYVTASLLHGIVAVMLSFHDAFSLPSLLCMGFKCSKRFSVTFDVHSRDVSQKRKIRLTLCKVCFQKDRDWKEQTTPFGVTVMRRKAYCPGCSGRYASLYRSQVIRLSGQMVYDTIWLSGATAVRWYTWQVKWYIILYGFQAI